MSKFHLALRGVLGLYSIECVEEVRFDPTILQHYDRLRSDFLFFCPPPPPPVAPVEGAPAAVVSADEAFRGRAHQRGCELIERLDAARDKITNADLYMLESAVVALSSLEALKQGYQSLLNRYRALAGAEVYKEYLIGQRPTVLQRTVVAQGDGQKTAAPQTDSQNDAQKSIPTNNDIEIYRADSLFLIREIRRYSILGPRREQIRRWLLIDVLAVTLMTLVLFSLSIVFRKPDWGFPVLRVVSVAALLGGLTSVLQRIQTIPEDQVILSLWNRISVVLGPLTSVVFALVFYEVFDAGFLSGTFFPDITKLYCAPTCVVAYTAETHRQMLANVNSLQFGKLIVWSFIAGFSERLVPDTLNGLIERQKTTTSK